MKNLRSAGTDRNAEAEQKKSLVAQYQRGITKWTTVLTPTPQPATAIQRHPQVNRRGVQCKASKRMYTREKAVYHQITLCKPKWKQRTSAKENKDYHWNRAIGYTNCLLELRAVCNSFIQKVSLFTNAIMSAPGSISKPVIWMSATLWSPDLK